MRPRPLGAARRVAALLALAIALAATGCSDEQPERSGEQTAATSPAQTSRPASTAAAGGGRPRAERARRITLTFSGDVLIHEPVWERALAFGAGRRYSFEPMFEPLRGVIRGADASVCHLETPLGDGEPQGYPVFRTPPELATALAETGWDACSTASNHSLDQGLEGIASTTAALERAGIAHTGTSARPGRRSGPAIIRAGGVQIALLSYTTDTNGLPVSEPASVDIAEPERILADAARARRAGADVVVVNIHWGSGLVPEYVSEPNDAQRDLVDRLLASRRITAVVGQGPHVVQPVELRGGRAVVFSEGNLISNQGADSGLAAASQDGIIVRLSITVRDRGRSRVTAARWLPIVTTRPDYIVAPATRRAAGSEPALDAPTARASYERTSAVAGSAGPVGPLGSPPP